MHPTTLLTLFLLPHTLLAALLHPAKRQIDLTIQDVCGPDAVDCGGGYCCERGSTCVAGKPPMCRSLRNPRVSVEAVDYSSFFDLVNLTKLLTVGITASTVPTTALFSQTAFPTYTENVVPTLTRQTSRAAAETATPTPGSGAAVLPYGRGSIIGGVIGLAVLLI